MGRKAISIEEKINYLKENGAYVDGMPDEDVSTKYKLIKQKEANKAYNLKKKNIAQEPVNYTYFEKASDILIELDSLTENLSYDELSRLKVMLNGVLDSINGDLKEKRETEKERLIAKLQALGYEAGLDF